MKTILKTSIIAVLVAYSNMLFATSLHYNLGQDDPACPLKFVTGFSGPEGTHRWTQGKRAEITIDTIDPMTKNHVANVKFENTQGLISDMHSQVLKVALNDQPYKQYVYDTAKPTNNITIPIPTEMNEVKITFDIDTAIKPALLKINDDKRDLGIAFSSVALTYVAP